MAQIKLLKIASDGVPLEFNSGADEITLLTGQFGNVKVSGNLIANQDVNGSLTVTPNGTGDLVLDGLKWPQADGTSGYFLQTNGAGQLSWSAQTDDLESFRVVNSYTAAVAVAIVDAVYISAADSVSKSIADSTSASFTIGFAKAAALITAPVEIVSNGVLGGFTGLTSGSRYYLSDSVAGSVTATIPTGSGKTIVQVGYAKSATAMNIQILQLGRRA